MPTCNRCKWWKVDVFYANIGACEKRSGAYEGSHESCEDYEGAAGESEFVWCTDCRTMAHRSELDKHKGHRLSSKFCCDDDAGDYISAGD